jgi:hypothetical protein
VLVGTAALAAAAGYAMARHSSPASVAVHHGTAQVTPAQVGVNADGVSYDIPLDVPWRDAAGGWHEGERPSCLPTTVTSTPVTFGAVKYALNGVSGSVVVWVDCSR